MSTAPPHPASPPDALAAGPAEPEYAPPAIAWEEEFAPLTAASKAAPNGPNQMSQLVGCDIL